MKKKYLFIAAALMGMSLSGCYDLDQQPQGELSSATAFGSTAEITLYLNQFYQGSVQISGGGSVTNTVIKGQSTNVGNASGIAFTDLNSDDLIGAVINTRLAGQTALSNAGDLIEYYIIRNINFLLHNINNCTEQGTTAFNQCLGEAYYFRAACYYQLLIKYGGVTWMEDLLDPDKSLMELPRNTRTEITDHILADLDLAIQNLNSVGSNASMRVHKDVARALKSEVALFAGTWEKYHRQKNTPFYDHTLSDADAQAKIQSYLTQAYQAAEEVMNTGTWRIHNTGNPLTDYRDMFIDLDLTDNQEVLWWKKYDAAAGIGHAVTRFLNKGGGQCGPSANLVDDYLTIDGRPFVGDESVVIRMAFVGRHLFAGSLLPYAGVDGRKKSVGLGESVVYVCDIQIVGKCYGLFVEGRAAYDEDFFFLVARRECTLYVGFRADVFPAGRRVVRDHYVGASR